MKDWTVSDFGWRSAFSAAKKFSSYRTIPALKGCVASTLFLVLSCLFVLPSFAQVTFDRLLNSAKEPQNWMTYSGDYSGKRFSALDQINSTNAHAITAKWVYQTGATGKLETTPLVVDGILYATAQDDRAFALDARTGRPIWMYQRQIPSDIRPCCGHVNRGVAILGDKVFLGTLDAHVVALDAKTGAVAWDVVAADYRTGHSFTVAPLAVKNLVIIGVSGGEYGVRGFIDAYDATTGGKKMAVLHRPKPGGTRTRFVGRRFLEGRRRPRLEHRNLRLSLESDFLAHRKSRALKSRRGTRRRQPLQQFAPRAQRRHRKNELVLSVHQA